MLARGSPDWTRWSPKHVSYRRERHVCPLLGSVSSHPPLTTGTTRAPAEGRRNGLQSSSEGVMYEVKVIARSLDPFVELVGSERVESVKQIAQVLRPALGTRAIWNINSAATGGG